MNTLNALDNLEMIFAACLFGGFLLAVVITGLSVVAGFLRAPRLRVLGALARAKAPFLGRVLGRGDGGLVPPGTFPVLLGLAPCFFGAIGLGCRLGFLWDESASLWTAGVGGVVGAVVYAWVLGRYFRTGQAREMESFNRVGAVGRVSTGIPVGGVGAVAYSCSGKRVSLPARSVDGRPLALRQRVMIVEMIGHLAVVEEL